MADEPQPMLAGRRAGLIDRAIARLPARTRWAAGAVRLMAREPADGVDRVRVRIQERIHPGATRRVDYTVDPGWHRRLHEKIASPWPCAGMADFERVWNEITEELRAQGLSLGRGTYGGWDDGDSALARAVWCLMILLRPERVVETGVARGVTSRMILEALDRTGTGHLWSIDLPAMDGTLHDQVGVAVPERLRSRWTYIVGTSRQRLPDLLAQIAPIDLFVHDSSHTERNMLFELQHAWPALRRGGLIADDIQQSRAFARFTATVTAADCYVAQADDGSALIGIALKGG